MNTTWYAIERWLKALAIRVFGLDIRLEGPAKTYSDLVWRYGYSRGVTCGQCRMWQYEMRELNDRGWCKKLRRNGGQDGPTTSERRACGLGHFLRIELE